MGAQNQPFLLRRWPFSIASLILAGTFACLAYRLYRVADRTSDFLPKLAEYALQISVIALLGAAVKEFLDWRNIARTQHEKQDGHRAEFLRRLREAHSQVSHSQYLMWVHNSGFITAPGRGANSREALFSGFRN